MKKKNLSILYKMAIILGGIIYISIVIFYCRKIGIDSDKANHLLQANDILHGNFFLKDWNLTGVSFLTTDLLYYEVVDFFFGVNYKAIYITRSLMISSIFFLGIFLVRYKKIEYRRYRCILYIVLCAIPYLFVVTNLSVHAGAVFLSLLNYLIVCKILDQNDRKNMLLRYLLLVIIGILGTMGDILMVIESIIPIIILSLFRVIVDGSSKKSTYICICITEIISMILGFAFDALYFFIGKANKNSYIGDRKFTYVSEWGDRLDSFISDLLSLSYADFYGNTINDIFNLIKGISFVLVLIATVFVLKVIIGLMKKNAKHIDEMSILLVLGMLMSFVCYVFTQMSQPRYIAIIPIAAVILLIRNIEWLCEKAEYKKVLLSLVMFMAIIICIGKIRDMILTEYSDSNNNIYDLITFLEEHNLHNGYASFWNSSNITVLSGEKINIRHIQKKGNKYEMFCWFNKNQWYEENTNFVLINNSASDRGNSDKYGVSEEQVIEFFGNPTDCYEVAGYIILVYDKNISRDLGEEKTQINIDLSDFYKSEGSNNIVIESGEFIYGPYYTIYPGKYNIIIDGYNLDDATYDVWSNETGMEYADYKEMIKTNDSIQLELNIYKTINDIEIRIYGNESNENIVINSISVNKLLK